MAAILAATSASTLRLLAPALIAGGCAAAIYGAVFTARALETGGAQNREPGRAFSVKVALLLAATMALMLIAAAALKEWAGAAGIAIGASAAGFVDTHSAAISVASLAASGKIAPQETVLPIMLAMTSNTISKIIMAITAGTGGFAIRIVPGLVFAIAMAWAALFATGALR